jgi:four helix bundle protein
LKIAKCELKCGGMSPLEMQRRTKSYAYRCVDVAEALPRRRFGNYVADQLLRCALSVAAHYRAACHAKSRADFISKLGTAEEEADESLLWLEALVDRRIVTEEKLAPLRDEGRQILSMIAASIRTAKRGK